MDDDSAPLTCWIVLDVETTGMPRGPPPGDRHGFHRIVQLAAAKFAWDMSMPSEFVTLVRPPVGVHIPPESTAIHHISDAKVHEANTPDFATAWAQFKRFAAVGNAVGDVLDDPEGGGRPRIGLVAHNMFGFDARMLRAELAACGLDPQAELDDQYVLGDSLLAFRAKFPSLPSATPSVSPYSLRHLHWHVFGSLFEGAHDALGDVHALRALLIETGVTGATDPPTTVDDDAKLTALRYVGGVRGSRLAAALQGQKTVGALRAHAATAPHALERILRDEARVFDDGQCLEIMRQVLPPGEAPVVLACPYFDYRKFRLLPSEIDILGQHGIRTKDEARWMCQYHFDGDTQAFARWLIDTCAFVPARARVLAAERG